jgi:endonuclease/exonuclease/phosphatase (EEP) superfamily protein YafD
VRYYRAGRAKVAQSIESLDPDVVLLSENRLGAAGLTELRADFPSYTFVSGRSDETAIASRLPILDAREVELPTKAPSLHRRNRPEDQVGHPHRSFMHARVDFHGTPVNVISIRFIGGRAASDALADRLAWGHYLLDTQRDELRFFLDYVSRLKGAIVFGGDFNAPPTAQLIRKLDGVASDAYLATHWVGLPTFPAKFPIMRLDYLFSMHGVVATDAERPELRVSDHDPILARFAVASS